MSVRTLRAKQISTGAWLGRLDTGDKAEDVFHAECAAQFGIDPRDIAVVVGSVKDEAERVALAMDLVDGTHQGAPVLMQPAPSAAKPTPLDAAIDKALASKSTDDILAALSALKATR